MVLRDPRSGDFAYCRLKPAKGNSYCAGHCRMAYRRPEAGARQSPHERQRSRALASLWRAPRGRSSLGRRRRFVERPLQPKNYRFKSSPAVRCAQNTGHSPRRGEHVKASQSRPPKKALGSLLFAKNCDSEMELCSLVPVKGARWPNLANLPARKGKRRAHGCRPTILQFQAGEPHRPQRVMSVAISPTSGAPTSIVRALRG